MPNHHLNLEYRAASSFLWVGNSFCVIVYLPCFGYVGGVPGHARTGILDSTAMGHVCSVF
jgi:hypothetical protein